MPQKAITQSLKSREVIPTKGVSRFWQSTSKSSRPWRSTLCPNHSQFPPAGNQPSCQNAVTSNSAERRYAAPRRRMSCPTTSQSGVRQPCQTVQHQPIPARECPDLPCLQLQSNPKGTGNPRGVYHYSPKPSPRQRESAGYATLFEGNPPLALQAQADNPCSTKI